MKMPNLFRNPILPRFYPDPSICRVGEEETEQWQPVAEGVDGRILSTPVAGGFVGAYIGMYTNSNGQSRENRADFDWFEYNSLA